MFPGICFLRPTIFCMHPTFYTPKCPILVHIEGAVHLEGTGRNSPVSTHLAQTLSNLFIQ